MHAKGKGKIPLRGHDKCQTEMKKNLELFSPELYV